jgi:hypothetical protein
VEFSFERFAEGVDIRETAVDRDISNAEFGAELELLSQPESLIQDVLIRRTIECLPE